MASHHQALTRSAFLVIGTVIDSLYVKLVYRSGLMCRLVGHDETTIEGVWLCKRCGP